MRRRVLLGAAGTLADWRSVAAAQTRQRVAQVGYLSRGALPPWRLDLLRQVLREHGFEEGRNLVIHVRSAAAEDLAGLQVLAAELVALGVDVIRANSDNPARAARAVTKTVPIVTTGAGDPVTMGFAASLARPGGNITGVTGRNTELMDKRVELLVEAFPGLARAGLLHAPTGLAPGTSGHQAQLAASRLGVELLLREIRTPQDIEPAIAAIAGAGVTVVLVSPSTLLLNNGPKIAEEARRHRLATIFPDRTGVEAGCLMSYGGDQRLTVRIASEYVARILKGEKPGDLPFQQIDRVELVISLRTARDIGVTLPPSLLARADEVIE